MIFSYCAVRVLRKWDRGVTEGTASANFCLSGGSRTNGVAMREQQSKDGWRNSMCLEYVVHELGLCKRSSGQSIEVGSFRSEVDDRCASSHGETGSSCATDFVTLACP